MIGTFVPVVPNKLSHDFARLTIFEYIPMYDDMMDWESTYLVRLTILKKSRTGVLKRMKDTDKTPLLF